MSANGDPVDGAAPIVWHERQPTLYEALSAQARGGAGGSAILAPGRSPLSFTELLDRLDDVRVALNKRGIGRGDRVAILAKHGADVAVGLLGIASCAVCVPLGADASAVELASSLAHSKAKALLLAADAPAMLKDQACRAGLLLLEYSVGKDAAIGKLNIVGNRAAAEVRGGFADADDLAFILRTSGTTGRRKILPLQHATVVARAGKQRRLYNLGPVDRCLNLMPLGYNHAINAGLICPLAAGGAVILAPDFDAENFFLCMREFLPTWYTAGFTHQQLILDWLQQRPDRLADHRLRFLRSGAGPLPVAVGTALEKLLGAPMLESYSTTETGTITAIPLSGPRKPGTVGLSPDDDVAIMGEDGRLLGAGTVGEVVVRGDTVFGGYEDDAEANRRAFRDGWFHTGDRGSVDRDGYLKLFGRVDEMINRGGEKISPVEVDELLLTHEAVAQAISFPIPHRTLHQEIAAAVVPRRGARVDETELRRFLAARLAPHKVPRIILCAAELPTGPTGKLNRRDMAARFGLDNLPAAAGGSEAPTKVREILLGLWREVLKRNDIGCDDDFFLAGGDSLSALDLLQRIEDEFQYRLPISMLAEAPTVNNFEDRIEKESLGAIDSNVCVNAEGTQPPLFAVFGRYGHVLRLLPVLRSLGPDQPAYGLQPPNMSWSNVGYSTLPQMAAYYVHVIKTLRPQGPHRLMGVSFGGIMAFEMALQLQQHGDVVESLVLVDSAPPNCLFDDGLYTASPWVIDDGPPRSAVEALNRSLAHTHLLARRDYVLDCRSGQAGFRGELIYFYCMGNPVVAGHDGRELWQRLASQFRLMPLPGSHGDVDKEPQFTAFRDSLRDLYRGETLAVADPQSVFGRDYRIQNCAQGECIVDQGDNVYRIAQDRIQGCVAAITADAERISLKGWAVEPGQRQPAQTIAVFLGGKYLGYGASGVLRDDIRNHLPDATRYAGFEFHLAHSGVTDGQLRLFVLSDGRAAELPVELEKRLVTWNELMKIASESEQMRKEFEQMRKESEQMRKEIEALKNSRSWRLTAPFRRLGMLAMRLRHSVMSE